MGMSSYVIGIKLPDDKWKQMKAVWDACVNANIEIPDEVYVYFGEEAPDEIGVTLNLDSTIVKHWSDGDMREGFEINLDNLPEDVKILRLINSW